MRHGGEVQPVVVRPALHKQHKGGSEPGREEEDIGGKEEERLGSVKV